MKKILVAEDSHALANLLEFVLDSAGFEAHVYPTGMAAKDAAMRDRYDMILLDQQMPELTGIEVAECIRVAEGPNRETSIFLCTAKTHEIDLEAIQQQLGLTGIFHKPFSPKELTDRLVAQAELEDSVPS